VLVYAREITAIGSLFTRYAAGEILVLSILVVIHQNLINQDLNEDEVCGALNLNRTGNRSGYDRRKIKI